MALTRKMLKAMSIDDSQIDQIIEAHTETTDALKADRDKYKEEAERVLEIEKAKDELQKELDEALKVADDTKAELEVAMAYKDKYENERTAFEDYKKDVDAKDEKARKADAYKSLLKEAGVSDKRIDAILKVTDTSNLVVNDEGKVEGAEQVVENIKSEWSEFIVTESKEGVKTETPPASTGGKPSKEDIMAIKDRGERQKAIAENIDVFKE